MSDLRLDSHKLIFHPTAVSNWLSGKDIYPISVEVGLTNLCNHRCTFCAVDYSDYRGVFLDKDIILKTLETLSKKGTKSVIFSGEGEPFLHKNAAEIITATKGFGLDVAVSTNGVLFTKAIAEQCLSSLTWIRFSVSAAAPELYAKIHRTKEADFDIALKNIENASKIKKRDKLGTTIGVQLLLLPENMSHAVPLAKMLKDIGADYFTVKPYSKHPGSINDSRPDYTQFDSETKEIEAQLKMLQSDSFKVYFRSNQLKQLSYDRPYTSCYGLAFMTHIDSTGSVIPCIMHFGNASYHFGNLYENDIETIWEQRHKVVDKINETKLKRCREVCRLNEMNLYLNELKNPGGHVNFV